MCVCVCVCFFIFYFCVTCKTQNKYLWVNLKQNDKHIHIRLKFSILFDFYVTWKSRIKQKLRRNKRL